MNILKDLPTSTDKQRAREPGDVQKKAAESRSEMEHETGPPAATLRSEAMVKENQAGWPAVGSWANGVGTVRR